MNILLTSVGRRTYLVDYFKDALNGQGKVYAVNSVYTYSMSHANYAELCPMIYDDHYIDYLLHFCKKNDVRAIISLFDIDLLVLAKNKQKFLDEGIQVIVSEEHVIEKCNDKWKTYEYLLQNNLPTPRTFISLEKAVDALTKGEISFPVVVKPRFGMGSIGIHFADDIDELNFFYKKIRKEIFSSYLKYESNAEKDSCIIIQEKISGKEFGLEVFNDFLGNMATYAAKEKIAMRAGETDIAETVEKKSFASIASKLSSTLKHIGNLDVDILQNNSGEYFILELNARFGGQYPFSHLAGINFPAQIIEWLKGNGNNERFLNYIVGKKICKDLTPVAMS